MKTIIKVKEYLVATGFRPGRILYFSIFCVYLSIVTIANVIAPVVGKVVAKHFLITKLTVYAWRHICYIMTVQIHHIKILHNLYNTGCSFNPDKK